MFEKIKKWYEQKLWNEKMVRTAVEKGILSFEQFKEIVGHDYP